MDHTDKHLAKAAIDKLKLGQTPTAREAEALKRLEREQEEKRRWEYYASVPQKHYRQMSGRAARVLIDQQARLGIPCAGKTVDIGAVIRWLHDFLADGAQIARSEESPGSKALERYRTANAQMQEMELGIRRGELVALDDVKVMVSSMVARLARCLELVENTIATEFSIWLIDPQVQAMSSDERSRMVRDFVAKVTRAVRTQEAQDVNAMIQADQAAEDSSEDEGVSP